MSILPTTPGLQTKFDNDVNDDLLHLLTDGWENPIKTTITESKWTRDYLSRLTSLPLPELLREPLELSQQQTNAKRDAQQLAFRNYPSFLHAQTCRREAEETLDGLDVHLDEFTSFVPDLQRVCEEFEVSARQVMQERNKITSVLEHQNVLTDLLEIPQLMETCVWNGYYSEAMDLASHVRLLQVRYPLSIIQSIQQQVQASSDLMLVQLISHLRKPIRLAAAMNVVGFLRRMDVFDSETELRMVFLRCRHDFLISRLDRVKRGGGAMGDVEDTTKKSSDAFEYMKRLIDVMREQMFEIGTQYISIFSSASATAEQGTLLSDYMVHITGLIKSALDTCLPMIEDTSALVSLLTQLQYCGMSLGRIGLDFRNVFVNSFEQAVQPMILDWIDVSTEDLIKRIVKSTEELSAPSTWMSSKTSQSHTEVQRKNAFQPPMLLVGYPSLAIFTNGILSAFNALRLLPAISLFTPIQNHLEACFLEIGNALKQYSDQAASHSPDEVPFLQSYTAAYVRCCVPYLRSCLVDGIYSGDNSDVSLNDQQEDLDLLLVDYLPIIVEKEEEAMMEDSILKKEQEDKEYVHTNVTDNRNAYENGKLEETTIQKEDSKSDELTQDQTIIEVEGKISNEEQLEEEKKENISITPNNEDTNSIEESILVENKKQDIEVLPAPTEAEIVLEGLVIEKDTNQEQEAAESVKPVVEEPTVQEVSAEEAFVVVEESTVQENKTKEEQQETTVEKNEEQFGEAEKIEETDDNLALEKDTPAIDSQPNDTVTEQPDTPTEEFPKMEEAENTQQNIEQQLERSSSTTIAHIDPITEEEGTQDKEKEETTKKIPQSQQQQKKSKKHKNKKSGNRR